MKTNTKHFSAAIKYATTFFAAIMLITGLHAQVTAQSPSAAGQIIQPAIRNDNAIMIALDSVPVPPGTEYDYYMKKSRSNKTVAWVLLGTGTASAVTGLVLGSNGDYAGILFVSLCPVFAIASVPFLNAASNNKRKANLYISSQKIGNVGPGMGKYIIGPAVAIRIGK